MNKFLENIKHNLAGTGSVIGVDRYKITSVLIPIICVDNEFHLLFQVRSENIPQAGEVCFPGGKFDPNHDKDTKDTAIRETIEEMGLHSLQITYIGKLGHHIAPMGVLVDAHVGIIDLDNTDKIAFNKHEVASIFSLPIKILKETPPQIYNVNIKVEPFVEENDEKKILLPYEKLGLPGKYKKSWGDYKHRIFVYDNEPIIWGITAEIIHEFVKLV